MEPKVKANNRKILVCRLGLICLIILLLGACKNTPNSEELEIKISNSSEFVKSDIVLELNDKDFIEKLNKLNFEMISVQEGKEDIPFQLVFDQEGKSIKSLLVNIDIQANETLSLIVLEDSNAENDFEKRTQAEISVKEKGEWQSVVKKNGTEQFEYIGGDFKNINYLRVPDKHTDHTFYIRYEGPGWESDKVAYRFYLDWRNAVDVFGKKTTEMILQDVGLDGFDSYHEDSEWGMDVLKVGKSLGLGSIAFWDGAEAQRIAKTDSITCHISQNGNLRSEITTTYYGWEENGQSTDLKSVISIDAGSRLTKQSVYTSSQMQNICTGIVNHNVKFLRSEEVDNTWSYIATYGKQSLNDDHLGMFIFYKTESLIDVVEDSYSYVLLLQAKNNLLEYYYGAAWELEENAISNEKEFLNYLEETLYKFNNPVKKIYK